MSKRYFSLTAVIMTMAAGIVMTGCGDEKAADKTATAQSGSKVTVEKTGGKADMAAVKDYAKDHASEMKTATGSLLTIAEKYYNVIKAANFNYKSAWDNQGKELAPLLAEAKTQWLAASLNYELNEGIVAGVPSLAHYDVWIDAGPSGEEDPVEALDWKLELPDGRVLNKPGNFFHHLTEPVLWGTVDEFVGLKVDLDGNGKVEMGEVMPEANIFLGAATGLDKATVEMSASIDAWEPTMEDAFTALVTMIPTMNEYFEQWKLSSFITGEAAEEASFVAVSRLFDITGILHGLDVTYDAVGPAVSGSDLALHAQIDSGFDDLVMYVDDLYSKEKAGVKFTPEEADAFGTEAQDKAQALAALVSQAATRLNLKLEL